MKQTGTLALLVSFIIMSSCTQKYYTYDAAEPEYSSNWKKDSHSNSPMPNEPGKCYAKCLIPDVYENKQEKIYIYSGDNYDQENINHVKKEIKPASTQWIKKKADKNCLSSNPEDCLVWCLQESPAEYEEFYEVLDTQTIKEFKIKTLEVRELVKLGGFTEWKEVICQNDLTQKVVSSINTQLYTLGYDVNKAPPKKINKKMKGALVKYQQDKALPRGQLDIETLNSLGINY